MNRRTGTDVKTTFPRRLFTVEEYHDMARTGILPEDDPVELIEGEIIRMSPIGSRHAACVDRMNRLLIQRVKGKAIVRVQSPVRLDDRSEPQPDITLLRPHPRYYANAHPGPSDILLLIEVSESAPLKERSLKLPVYARAKVREVWIVDLSADRVEVHLEPAREGYRRIRKERRGSILSASAMKSLKLGVSEVLE